MALDTLRATAILRGITQRFWAAKESVDVFYPRISTIIPSSGRDEAYGALGDVPGMREWLGDRVFKELRGAQYTLVNKDWEQSLQIPRYDIDDDRLGVYGPVAAQLGMEAAAHPDELLLSVIVAGATTVAWDGQYFFDTDHSWGDSGSQSNKLSVDISAPTAPTAADIKSGFNQARLAMVRFKNDQGKYLNRTTLTSMRNLMWFCPPEWEQSSREALETTIYGPANQGGNQNVVIDQPQIVTSPLLTALDTGYLFNVGAPLRPFIFQSRQPLRTQTKGNDDIEFKVLKFMTEARYNVGYGLWTSAVSVTFT